jgi:hypothetical protein
MLDFDTHVVRHLESIRAAMSLRGSSEHRVAHGAKCAPYNVLFNKINKSGLQLDYHIEGIDSASRALFRPRRELGAGTVVEGIER